MGRDGAISLVVTDLDGTLWRTDDDVHPAVVAALAAVGATGVPLLVATGRRATSARRPLARIGLAPPAVVMNGALGIDLASGERFHTRAFTVSEAVATLAVLGEHGFDPVVYVDDPDVDVVLGPTPATSPEHVRTLRSRARTGRLAEVVRQIPVLGFGVAGVAYERCAELCAALADVAVAYLDRSLQDVAVGAVRVAPPGTSKWDGVEAFCQLHALPESRVLVVADGPNDLELLERAAVALVPEASHELALGRAHHVIPAVTEGGWAAVLDHL